MDKRTARMKVWDELIDVSVPDSRFHLDFNEYIPEFFGGDQALERLVDLDAYKNSQLPFITPDNCLEKLRYRLLCDQKHFLATTFGIRRGFVYLDPKKIEREQYLYGSTLDGMEVVGQYRDLKDLCGNEVIDLVVTGASAISRNGVRFGKGHGYFDLEWGILHDLNLVNERTVVVAFVHDCQVVDDLLEPSDYDTVCDLIVTPTSVISVKHAPKPKIGIVWDQLQPGMLQAIPPLQELYHMLEN